MGYYHAGRFIRRGLALTGYDFSMLSDSDVANIILQRSEIVSAGREIREWMEGNSAPLLALARDKRHELLARALEAARTACETFTKATDDIAPARLADIGCGYAFADLFLHQRYDCDLVLIDIESHDGPGDDRCFGFNTTHPGYTSLARARQFLEANGVSGTRITTSNPRREAVSALGKFDLVISLLSCGFHYPVDTYESLFRDQINPEGGIVVDVRRGSGGIGALKKFGGVLMLNTHKKHSRVLVRAGDLTGH